MLWVDKFGCGLNLSFFLVSGELGVCVCVLRRWVEFGSVSEVAVQW